MGPYSTSNQTSNHFHLLGGNTNVWWWIPEHYPKGSDLPESGPALSGTSPYMFTDSRVAVTATFIT